MRIPQEVLHKANATGESFISSTKPVTHIKTTFEVVLCYSCTIVLAFFIAKVLCKVIKQMNLKKLFRRALGMALILLLVKYETLDISEIAGMNMGLNMGFDEIVKAMGELSIDVFVGAGLLSWAMM